MRAKLAAGIPVDAMSLHKGFQDILLRYASPWKNREGFCNPTNSVSNADWASA